MTRHSSLHLQNSEYPRIFRVTGANQNAQKLLSTDLVNTNNNYFVIHDQQARVFESLLEEHVVDNLQGTILNYHELYFSQYHN